MLVAGLIQAATAGESVTLKGADKSPLNPKPEALHLRSITTESLNIRFLRHEDDDCSRTVSSSMSMNSLNSPY